MSGEINDLYSECQRLASLAQLEIDETRFARALAFQERRAAKWRLLGSRPQIAHALHDLAIVARRMGNVTRALQTYEESRALFQDLGQYPEAAAVRASLGHLHVERGAFAQAAATFAETLGVLSRQDTELGMATVLAGLGGFALRAARPADAARLLGMAEALLDRLQRGPLDLAIRFQWSLPGYQFRRDVVHTRELRTLGRVAFESMGSAAFEAALDAGRALSTAEAVALGLEYVERSATGTLPASAGVEVASRPPLSQRETEVLRLIADGNSNQAIATALLLSLRTVERHIANLYAKVGARNRADATAYAIRHGIALP